MQSPEVWGPPVIGSAPVAVGGLRDEVPQKLKRYFGPAKGGIAQWPVGHP